MTEDKAERLAVLRAELLARTEVLKTPDEIDPRSLAPIDWREYGIPPRPDLTQAPRQYEFWQRMFSQKLRIVDADFQFREPLILHRPANNSGAGIFGLSRHQASANWSGAYITPRDRRRFISIHGCWRVPKPVLPAQFPAGEEYRSSTWIGFDGQRRYLHASLPQIGTAQALDVQGQPLPPEAWFQWWLRDHHNPPVTIAGLPVDFDDEIMAALTVVDERHVLCHIVNLTKRILVRPFLEEAPTALLQGGTQSIPVLVSGATAEWVLERPSYWMEDRPYALPDYGEADFTGFAVSARLDGSGPREESFDGARLIHMYEARTSPPRTHKISVPHKLDDRRFRTLYR